MHYFYLALAILCEVAATSALKAAEGFTRPLPSAVVVVGYGAAFFLLSLTLKTLPMGMVYAIWSGAGIVLISLVGWLWYRQPLDLPTVVGMALIICGVAVLHLFSRASGH